MLQIETHIRLQLDLKQNNNLTFIIMTKNIKNFNIFFYKGNKKRKRYINSILFKLLQQ